jgi:hypothetical protein
MSTSTSPSTALLVAMQESERFEHFLLGKPSCDSAIQLFRVAKREIFRDFPLDSVRVAR